MAEIEIRYDNSRFVTEPFGIDEFAAGERENVENVTNYLHERESIEGQR